jgi:uncharacterized protein (TIGR00369 family)
MSLLSESYFSRLQRGEAELPAVTITLGGEIYQVDLEAGALESAYMATPEFLNPAGQVQGGMLCAMLDDVTAFLVTAMLAEGEFCATLNLNVSFLRAAKAGAVEGRARLLRRGKDVFNVNGELWQGGKLVASAAATCLVVRQAAAVS